MFVAKKKQWTEAVASYIISELFMQRLMFEATEAIVKVNNK